VSHTLVHDPRADHEFLGSRRVDDRRWQVPVVGGLVVPHGGLYGGAGLAAVIAAMEAATDRPLRWVTSQFVSTATVGETLEVEVSVDKQGKRISQASAVARVGDRVVVRAIAALGAARPEAPRGVWIEMPDVPGPDECEPSVMPIETSGTAVERGERRLARGPAWGEFLTDEPRPPGFRICMWSRVRDHVSSTPAMLGWLADMVPMALAGGLGAPFGGTSLDNTLRMVASREVDWVLLDVHPTAATDGYGHGDVFLWAPDGTLLATGSQTAVLRQRLPESLTQQER
jgi:acyl-CoA thioesterase II